MTPTLTLGTASLGLPGYGVASRHTLTADESRALLREATERGLALDTAAAYGNAEELIGTTQLHGDPAITTKLLPGLDCHPDLLPRLIEGEVRASRTRLGIGPHVALTVLFHTPAQGADPRRVDALKRCRDLGLCARIGTSVYTPEDLVAIAPGQDVVQLPYSLLDRRFESMLPVAGYAVQARAPFCQGLALVDPAVAAQLAVPPVIVPLLETFQRVCSEYEFDPAEAALLFALEAPVETVVFGVDDAGQFADNLRAPGILAQDEGDRARWTACLAALRDEVPLADAEVVNPSLWARG